MGSGAIAIKRLAEGAAGVGDNTGQPLHVPAEHTAEGGGERAVCPRPPTALGAVRMMHEAKAAMELPALALPRLLPGAPHAQELPILTPPLVVAPQRRVPLEQPHEEPRRLLLLHETRVDTQLNSQLYDSYNGLTILAPTDAAFEDLPSGTMNGLSSQDQIQMMLYCVLPRFYSLSMLGTLNGKVSTQASGSDGPYEYKIKPSGSNVNVSTGVKGNNMLLSTIVSKEFPLAVYSVDKVPLPYALFGPQPPTPAPAPAPAPSKSKSKKKKKVIADPPESDSDDSTASDTKSAAAARVSASRWVAAAALAVLGAAGGVLL